MDWQALIMRTPVFIVLATYNGVKFIGQQIESLLSQTFPCHIYIFDDGSTDGTIEFIRDNYLSLSNIHLRINAKRLGFVKNFEQGIKTVYDLGAQYVALSDQDDIWCNDKLANIISALEAGDQTAGHPTLAYSDLQMVDINGDPTHSSYLKYRGYKNRGNDSLATALGQNGVMGNTILMNRALVEHVLPFPDNLHSHDYWISLIAQLQGRCVFISKPLVKYRIHDQNASNSVQTLAGTPEYSTSFWQRLVLRNYRLPYKEDTRVQTLSKALELIGQNNDTVSKHDAMLIKGFLHYLNFDKPRWYLAYWMLRHRFIRKSLKFKLLFTYRILVTSRYPPSQ